MGYTRTGNVMYVWEEQDDETFTQASPVQNTWYTIFDERNVRVYAATIMVETTAETLEVQVTFGSGAVKDRTALSATADTSYNLIRRFSANTANADKITTNTGAIDERTFVWEGTNVKIEMRKTTANGTGDLSAVVQYAKKVRG